MRRADGGTSLVRRHMAIGWGCLDGGRRRQAGGVAVP